MNFKLTLRQTLGAAVGIILLSCLEAHGQYDLPGLGSQVAQARSAYDDSLDRLVQIRNGEMLQAQASQAYVAAKQAVADTYQHYKDDQTRTAADLETSSSDYRQLLKQKQDVQTQLEAARKDPGTTVQQFNDLYNDKSAIDKQMRAMQAAAIEKAGGGERYQQWQTASRDLETLQAQIKAQIERSPAVVTAQAEVDAAKSNVDRLNIQLASARAADNAAAAAQENSAAYDQANSALGYNGYGSDPYGYGYGYGYGTVIIRHPHRTYRGGYIGAHGGGGRRTGGAGGHRR